MFSRKSIVQFKEVYSTNACFVLVLKILYGFKIFGIGKTYRIAQWNMS